MGSNVLDDMAQYLKLQLPLMLPFECIGEYAITPQEFIDHMRVHRYIYIYKYIYILYTI